MKEFLSRQDIDFTEKNVGMDPQALEELLKMGYRAVPVTLIGEEAVLGFDQEHLERVLNSQNS